MFLFQQSQLTERVSNNTKLGMRQFYFSGLLRRIDSHCSNLSNFYYKPQIESRQQHLALYMDRRLHALALMVEVTSRHMEYTHFDLDYNQMPDVALHHYGSKATKVSNYSRYILKVRFIFVYSFRFHMSKFYMNRINFRTFLICLTLEVMARCSAVFAQLLSP